MRMRTVTWLYTAAFLVGIGAAAASAETPARDPDEARFKNLLLTLGEQEFSRNCAVCHGNDGHGNGPAAPALRTPPADLTRIAERRGGKFPDAEIAAKIDGRFEVIAHGSREMPVWGVHLGQ